MDNGAVKPVPTRRVCGLLLAASGLLCGCVSTVEGAAVRAQGAAPVDVGVLDEAALGRLILTIGEVNGIMGSTQMKVTGELDQMTDHSDEVSDPDCLGAVYGAEEPVYARTGWTAVRDQVAREPDDDNDHWVEQTAVLYPTAQAATMFLDTSFTTWQGCAGESIDVGDGEYSWQLGDVDATDTGGVDLITQMTTQQGADGWECQHALSAVSNATVEAWACGYNITGEAAEIATAMVGKARK
ncbi:Serine/threonine-protein kinase PknH [Mycolicibacterium chlorophenolicum]|uniref:Serine/threonine-protein kinase PknH n=1 Tax=Mycolicibacterium chlorophenolicum TaxID=37916 RepID=A0A0J6WKT8_9MYCO|nr:Serine/threonine-protein kinase PknH [Mycolicibacterium chlorophenolicum]